MKELNQNQIEEVAGGVDVSDMFLAGASGALGGASLGVGIGVFAGAGVFSVPAAGVLGGMGAGIGFISGLVIYAFTSE
jgi:hypothetical protein